MKSLFWCLAGLLSTSLGNAQTSSTSTNSIILAGSGYSTLSPALSVAPGQVIVLHVHGVTTAIDNPIAAVAGANGLPYSLSGISVDLLQGNPTTVTNLQLRAIYQTHCLAPCSPETGITLQVPFTLASNSAGAGATPPQLQISQDGKPVGAVALLPVTDNVHVINTCDNDQIYIPAAVSVPQNICASDVMVGGSLNSLYNLAHAGDELAMWLFGMGAISQPAPGCCVSPDQLAKPIQTFQLNFDFRPNAPAFPVVPGFGLTGAPLFAAHVGEGTYQVNFMVPPVPAGLPACDGVKVKSNLTVTITGPNSSDAAMICVLPQ
jgi:hypothetical protein